MRKFIVIKADTNDADYVTSKHLINDEQLKLVEPIIEAIKKFRSYKGKEYHSEYFHEHSHNFPTGECIRKDLGELSAEDYYTDHGISQEQFDIFREYIPDSEYGIHTIVSVDILIIAGEINLL